MGSMSPRLRVLFLCTHNACRSQMAEAWAKHLKADQIEAFSAGTIATTVNPLAIKAMNEVGIDISGSTSKSIHDLLRQGMRFDCIVTVCDEAAEACPIPSAPAHIVHAPFPDPHRLAQTAATEEEGFEHYRRVRDQIRDYVQTLPESLVQHGGHRAHREEEAE
jgi:arsenate reductase (thioredoxin)